MTVDCKVCSLSHPRTLTTTNAGLSQLMLRKAPSCIYRGRTYVRFIQRPYFYPPDLKPDPAYSTPALQMASSKANADSRKRRAVKNNQFAGNETAFTRLSKTLSWVLRHGAKDTEGLRMRPDGYVRVSELLNNPALPQFNNITFPVIEEIVGKDAKNRYNLVQEPDEELVNAPSVWWIRANQGHSMTTVQLQLETITSPEQVTMVVHGTSERAWQSIRKQGLSKMNRNHIHFATGLANAEGVVSGMRTSSKILIYIDLGKALQAGYEFFLSKNGVVLCAGDDRGLLPTRFFLRVESNSGAAIPLSEYQTVDTIEQSPS